MSEENVEIAVRRILRQGCRPANAYPSVSRVSAAGRLGTVGEFEAYCPR